MKAFDQKRRLLLISAGALGASRLLSQTVTEVEGGTRQGYVLAPAQGENLVHFRDGGKVSIKVGPATGSNRLALGSQQVMRGTGIPIHRHFQTDEAFYILEGSGIFLLNDVRHSFEKGATIFIPRTSWHGFENPYNELLLLWIVSPPGLDGFFRETCNPAGVPAKKFTREQIRQIALKYGTEFRE